MADNYAMEDIMQMIRDGIADIELAEEMVERYEDGAPLQFKVVIRAGDYYFDRIWKLQKTSKIQED